MEHEYFQIPSRNEVYKVTPDSGYVVVMYDGPVIDFQMRVDGPHNKLNSWDLRCYCAPVLKIIPISKEEYEEKYRLVISILKSRAA